MTGRRPGGKDLKTRGPIRKRKNIDLEKKLKIIAKFEGGQSLSSIARELCLAASTVNTIVKDSARIKEHAKGSVSLKSTVITKQRSGAITEMEKLLTVWLKDRVEKGVPRSLATIQAKARSIYESIRPKYGDCEAKFLASNGWFNRFKHRAGLSDVTLTGEPGYRERGFIGELKRNIDAGDYSRRQVFTVDRTALFWKKMPDSADIADEAKRLKDGRDRLKLWLGANAAGDCKLKPLLVYRSESPRALKGVSKATLPVYFRWNGKACDNISIFEDWFVNCFIPEVEKYCRENGVPFKILLVVNEAPGSSPYLDDFHCDVKVVFLPSGGVSFVRGVLKQFKAHYLRSVLQQALLSAEDSPFSDFWKSFTIYHGIMNIAKAWGEIGQNHFNGAWWKVYPRFARGFVEKETYEGTVGKIVELAERSGLRLGAEDVERLIESHEEELSGEELSEPEAAEAEEADDVGPAEEPRRFIAEEMAIAFREIASAMARFEKMDPNATRFLEVNRGVEEVLECYREIYEDKKKARAESNVDIFLAKVETSSPVASTSIRDLLPVDDLDVYDETAGTSGSSSNI